MLSRTANSLFWMARYLERAENLARLIDMGRRAAATPNPADRERERRGEPKRNPWAAALAASGGAAAFSGAIDGRRVIAHLLLDPENPSSVRSCFENARANARSARAAITTEMWEAVNDAWREVREMPTQCPSNGALAPIIDETKRRGALMRGAADGTILRNDGYDFFRLGFFVERLDNIARLVMTKSRTLDAYECAATLRGAGVLRAYQAAYREDYDAVRVFDFLIANPHCPRSVAYCARQISAHLDSLAWFYGARRPCQDAAALLLSEVIEFSVSDGADPARWARIEEFLDAVLRRNNALSMAIAESYDFAPKAPEAAVSAQAEASEDGDLFEGADEEPDAAAPALTAAQSQFQTSRRAAAAGTPPAAKGVAAE